MMKLGTETGSLVNHIASRGKIPEITVGMGATLLSWSDRTPGTVVDIKGNIVAVQEDNYTRTDNNGMSEMQEYEYTPNPQGTIHFFRIKGERVEKIHRNGETKRWNKIADGGVAFGRRERYYDFSF